MQDLPTINKLEAELHMLALKLGHLPPVVIQSAMFNMSRINKLIQELKKEEKGN